jgi:hypothetical protein
MVYFASFSSFILILPHITFWLFLLYYCLFIHTIYGVYLATSTELVAYKRNRKSISALINADNIVFLTLGDLEAACSKLSPHPKQRLNLCLLLDIRGPRVPQGYLEKLDNARGKPQAIWRDHNGAFVIVGDSMTTHTIVSERLDICLRNLVGDTNNMIIWQREVFEIRSWCPCRICARDTLFLDHANLRELGLER